MGVYETIRKESVGTENVILFANMILRPTNLIGNLSSLYFLAPPQLS